MDTFPIIHCADLERSLHFYRDEFGFTLKFRWPDEGPLEFAYLVRDGSGLGLGRPNGDDYGLPVRTGLPATLSSARMSTTWMRSTRSSSSAGSAGWPSRRIGRGENGSRTSRTPTVIRSS